MKTIISYYYIPSVSDTIDRSPGLFIGQVLDEELGTYVLRGGNGSWVIVTPAHVWTRVGESLDAKQTETFDIYDILKDFSKALSKDKLRKGFINLVCNWLIGKEVQEDDVSGSIRSLLWNNLGLFSKQ